MRVVSVEIRNFRNHSRTILECAGGVNALIGNNGEGKTNIIEAISFLCLTKSFYAGSDQVALQIGKDEFVVTGVFEADSGAGRRVETRYDRTTGKKTVSVNGSDVEVLSSLIGEHPVVILSPEQSGITFGAPAERRRFLDLVISQSSRLYLEELLEYRRILRQRNKILLEARLTRREAGEVLEPWTESLIETGSALMLRRARFISAFAGEVIQAHDRICGGGEAPKIEYRPSVLAEAESTDAIRVAFRGALEERSEEEGRTGVTAAGPHRDEIELRINDIQARKFASQGQHKTLLISLKLAEFAYLRNSCRETPMLLLDDVFSELDAMRASRLVDEIGALGQVFVTATDLRAFPGSFAWNGENRRQTIVQGAVSGAIENTQVHAVAGNSH